MKKDKLFEAIAMLDDDMIADAIQVKPAKRHIFMRIAAVAAAGFLVLGIGMASAVRFGSTEAYALMYMIFPAAAQSFKPVQKSCTDNGIKLDVISAEIEGERASVCLSLTDMEQDRIDETTDLYDSYNINCPFDSVGYCSFSEYDEVSKTAYYIVNIERMDGKDIENKKVTFGLRELLYKKSETKGIIDEISLDDVPKNPKINHEADVSGCSESDLWKNYGVMLPFDEAVSEPVDGVSVTAIGWWEGFLHIQTRYEDSLKTDNHGFVSLISKSDGSISESSSVAVFWDTDGKSRVYESLFEISYEDLKNYDVFGEFITSGGNISGDWEVTFSLE